MTSFFSQQYFGVFLFQLAIKASWYFVFLNYLLLEIFWQLRNRTL